MNSGFMIDSGKEAQGRLWEASSLILNRVARRSLFIGSRSLMAACNDTISAMLWEASWIWLSLQGIARAPEPHRVTAQQLRVSRSVGAAQALRQPSTHLLVSRIL